MTGRRPCPPPGSHGAEPAPSPRPSPPRGRGRLARRALFAFPAVASVSPPFVVMPGLVPGIHVPPPPRPFPAHTATPQDVDARNKSIAVRFGFCGPGERHGYERGSRGSLDARHGFRRVGTFRHFPPLSPRPCAGVQGNGTVLARLLWTPAQGRGDSGGRRRSRSWAWSLPRSLNRTAVEQVRA